MVSGSLSATEGDEQSNVRHPFYTYAERFYEMFPYYLSIGMTYEQYWDGEPKLTAYYRKADELRSNRKNQELWLQGMYVYEAICDASPILHAFAKKGAKPLPYTTSPYPLTESEQKHNAEEKERKIADKGKNFMENIMIQNNKRFDGKTLTDENKGGERNVNNN